MWSDRIAADLILVLHATFVGFVVLGLPVILLGWLFSWSWVRNVWFRGAHLACIGYVVLQTWAGVPCPLTMWENELRRRAGQEPYGEGGCIADWLHRLIFVHAEPWVFTTVYTAFGLLVLATFFLAPPRLPRKQHYAGLTPPPAGP